MTDANNVVRLKKHRLTQISELKAERLRQMALGLFDGDEQEAFEHALLTITKHKANDKTWRFVMLSPDQALIAISLIDEVRNPYETTKVWNAVLCYMDWDTGHIAVDRNTLADKCKMLPTNVSHSLKQLVDIKILYRRKRPDGKFAYYCNPNIGWRGTEEGRQKAVAEVMQLDMFR
jgi:hypothetical protein